MNNWKKLGLAGLVAVALASGAQRADAACIERARRQHRRRRCLFADGGVDRQLPSRMVASTWTALELRRPIPKKIECVGRRGLRRRRRGQRRVRVPRRRLREPAGGGLRRRRRQRRSRSRSLRPRTPTTPSSSSGVYNRYTLPDALDAIPPNAGTEACTDADIAVKVDLKSKGGICNEPAGENCTSDLDCDDYCMPTFKKDKANVTLERRRRRTAALARLKFTCNCRRRPATHQRRRGLPGRQSGRPDRRTAGDGPGRRLDDPQRQHPRDRPRRRPRALVHAASRRPDHGCRHRARRPGRRPRQLARHPASGQHLASTQDTQNISVVNDGTDCQPAIIRTSGPDDCSTTIAGHRILRPATPCRCRADTVDTDLALNLTTDYILRPDSNYVQVATTITEHQRQRRRSVHGRLPQRRRPAGDFGPGHGFGETQLRKAATGRASSRRVSTSGVPGRRGRGGRHLRHGVPALTNQSGLRARSTREHFTQSGVGAGPAQPTCSTSADSAAKAKPEGRSSCRPTARTRCVAGSSSARRLRT